MYLQTSQEAKKKSKHQREDKRNFQVNIGNEQFNIVMVLWFLSSIETV